MDLENLFKWSNNFVIKDKQGNEVEVDGKPLTLYQRVVGDAELAEARKNALYASRKLRKALRDEASAERATLLPEYEDMTNEELKNAIILTEGTQLRRRAEEMADLPKYPVKPKGDSLEAEEEYQIALDNYEKKKREEVNKQLEKILNKKKEELKGLHTETLQERFIEAVIKTIARSRMLEVFNQWCAYLGTYKDKAMTKRAFKSFEAFDNSATELKEQILDHYIELEFGGGNLKKLQSATNSEESGSSQES